MADFFFPEFLAILANDPFCAFTVHTDTNLDDDEFDGLSVGATLSGLIDLHPRALQCVHVNAQSLVQHFDYLTELFLSCKVHVIAVSESWLKPSLDAQLPQYNLFRNDRLNKGGGGVGLYIRHDLAAEVVTASPSEYSSKCEFLFVKSSVGHKKFLIGVIYKPPSVDKNFCDYEESLSSFIADYDDVIILGDHNSDLLADKPESRHVKSMYESLNLNILQSEPTHHKAILDLIVVSNLSRVLNFKQLPAPGFSHHDLLFLSYSLKVFKFQPKIITYRDMKNVNLNDLRADVGTLPWYQIFELRSVDDKVNLLNSLILEAYDKHAPLVSRRVTHPPAPWLDDNIRNLMRRRDCAYRKYRQLKTPHAFEKFRILRNKTKQCVRNAKFRFTNSLQRDHGKQLWDKLKFLGIGRRPQNLASKIDVNSINQECIMAAPPSDPNMVTRTCNKILSQANQENLFHFTPVTEAQVYESFSGLKSNAQAFDNISLSLLNNILDCILPYVTHIFNASLSSGEFPSTWKFAKVIPLPKNNSLNCNEVRPISILPVLSKALEKIVFFQLNEFLNINDLLDPYQSGFRSGFSTSSALIHVVDELASGMDEDSLSLLVLLDLTKAFQSVDFDILLAQLKAIGCSDLVAKWFDSYLKGRSQAVVYKDETSSPLPLHNGVPTGSILAPLLFSIYLLGLPASLLNCKYHLYADDLQIYITFKSIDLVGAVNLVNSDLQRLSLWTQLRCLKINPAKTQCMLLGNPKATARVMNSSPPPILINNSIVPYSQDRIKDLGVWIDPALTWSPHISSICQKVHFSLHSLSKLKHLAPLSVKKFLINSLIMPLFDYCDVVYSSCREIDAIRLQRAANYCIRFIFGAKRSDHISPLLGQLGWLRLDKRRKLHSLLVLHKLLNDSSVHYLVDKVNTLNTSRNGILLEIPRHKTAHYSRHFKIDSARLWNALPAEIRSLTGSAFKNKVHAHFLSDR